MPAPTPGRPPSTSYDGSWVARPLVSSGPVTSPTPTVLNREDGSSLLYRGRIHTLIGPPSSLKTWTAFLAAAQELRREQSVVWIDFEDNEATALDRLLALGVPQQLIDKLFVYIHPEERLTEEAEAYLSALLRARRPSLIIVDSTTDFIYQQGGEGTSSDSFDTQGFHAHLKNFATWYGAAAPSDGAAVVAIDHVTKNAETRGQWAIGSQRKISGLTGVAYKVTLLEQFGIGKTGSALLEVVKDRPGRVDSIANERRVIGKLTLTSDRLTGKVTAALVAPSAADGHLVEDLMRKVSTMLASEPGGLKKGDLTKHFKDRSHELESALRQLTKEGHIVIEQIGPAKLHKLLKPYPTPDNASLPSS